MTGDHHGQTAGMATLLTRALDGLLGTHTSPLYVTIRNMAMEQVEVLDEVMRRQEAGQSVRVAQMRTF
jgi:hypothetical protein